MLSGRFALLTLLVVAANVCAASSGKEDECQRLTAIVQPLIDQGHLRSAVLGVIDATGRRIYPFGRLSAAPDAKAPDGDTVYEIASVTKVFTATLLAEMAQRKEVALDDPASKYLPDSVTLPQTDAPITLLALATHHSGLPRMPSDFDPADPADPYADYTVDKLYASLACEAAHPTATFEYSNFAYGLLGHVLSLRAKQSYEDLIVSRIAKPLGMNDTRITLTPAMAKRLAPPFDSDLAPAHAWDFAAVPAGGALRSTANDLLKFLAAELDLPAAAGAPDSLRRAIASTQQPRADTENPSTRIGLGWHITKPGVLWHNGQTGGYHSFVTFDKKARVGVVLLTNTATMDVDRLGTRALAALLKGSE